MIYYEINFSVYLTVKKSYPLKYPIIDNLLIAELWQNEDEDDLDEAEQDREPGCGYRGQSLESDNYRQDRQIDRWMDGQQRIESPAAGIEENRWNLIIIDRIDRQIDRWIAEDREPSLFKKCILDNEQARNPKNKLGNCKFSIIRTIVKRALYIQDIQIVRPPILIRLSSKHLFCNEN